jgi:cGMP-dependent protein kinase 1
VNEGEQADSFYTIKKGTVQIYQNGKPVRTMQAGESFGESALLQNQVRGATVKAIDENVKCLALSRDTLTKILGDKI